MLINNSRGSEWKKCDLHMHSTASDGTATPEELVDEAKRRGVSIIALTDHHTVDNIDEIKCYAKTQDITVISGIEFRTEYGQKSVHMIGVFPEKNNGILLNQKALYELILSPLDLTKTKIEAAGREGHPEYSDEKAYKEGLLRVQVDFKTAADLIHKYGGIVSVHAGGKTNSFDEEMKHDGPAKKNVGLADSLGPVKEELLRNYIDICEVRNRREVGFYLKCWGKPCIAASDAHSIKEVARNYCWIKGDASFEGLKQILFEPSGRVRIQEGEPEIKPDYLVIDNIEIDDENFGHQIIPFNQGLNTIIGGRSSGKSILLGCIARLCGDKTPIKPNKPQYDTYINDISQCMKLHWRDSGKEIKRKIDFFPQSYIIEMASDPQKIKELIENIMRDENGENRDLVILKSRLEANKVLLHQLFSDFRKKMDELRNLNSDIRAIGNQNGIRQEISKLKNNILTIKETIQGGLSNDEVTKFAEQKEKISALKLKAKEQRESIGSIQQLKDISLFIDMEFTFSLMKDDKLRQRIKDKYHALESETRKKWIEIMSIFEIECNETIFRNERNVFEIEQDVIYKKANKIYEENSKLVEINLKLEKEEEKLNKINQLSEHIKQVQEDILNILKKINSSYKKFYNIQQEYCEPHIINRGDVTITPKIVFKARQFQQNIAKYFDGRSAKNNDILNYIYKDSDSFSTFMKEVLRKIIKKEYVFKNIYTFNEVAEDLFSSNPFEVEYNINYQGDNLEEMSEGKTAFVILRLLLDFSTNEYPILIDQPEDDLDNRAIFGDLVTYLKEKKTRRQIILVTHNPNIVVGADAEEIIVANQQGLGNSNPENVKFAYITGSLENTYECDDESVLLRQGIREHVCDLLEGGDKAFQLREQKYQLK